MKMNANVMGSKATNTLRSMLDGKAHDGFEQLLPKLGLSYRLAQRAATCMPP